MKLIVQPVGTQYVHQTWPLVEELFAKANKYDTGDYTLDQIRGLLANGSWVLLVAIDEENNIHGAASVSFYNMPNYRVGFITAMAGKAIVNEDVYGQVCSFIRRMGLQEFSALLENLQLDCINRLVWKSATLLWKLSYEYLKIFQQTPRMV